ncbi:hypothetical protein M430DRAFT_98158 [Amorphotheca resinae ATCC 22711]|uniref:Major facilitator superfamily (MFS) profile domain-containing protein n=1 Tax=Amorphotheca resinae ATCC 22711 TaxID=857342 RepID=A0A2T3B7Y4_AMORE|nr:hypothetical protein M430DRAFT_98158 [Amorphotheca resinae ATCC 22711]PSS22947.1 hypothetical protein M430DRAFT_98158 [Amorphotheca resinae ATCC 22711]
MGSFYKGYLSTISGNWLQTGVTLCSAMTFLLFGYDQGVFGGLIATPQLLNGLHIAASDADTQGTVTAIYNIGCLVGCLICATIGQKLGRRIYIVIGGLILILGASIQAGSNGTGMMIAGRVIAGVGTGMETSFIPIWVSECARAAHRGALIAIQLSLVLFGLSLAYWFDYGTTNNLTGSVVWRLPLAFQVVFVLIMLCTVFLLPESPRWLYSHGHLKDADDVMARILQIPVDHPTVLAHRAEVLEALKIEKETKFHLKNIFFDDSPINTSWRIWLGVIVQFLQQLGGINLIAYYASYIFIHNLGKTQQQASLLSGGLSLVFWGGSLTSIYTVERYGRRPVLLIGAICTSIAMILFTIGLALNTYHSLILSIVFIFLFEFTFGASWCIVPWMYAPEVTPLHVRHIGASLAVGMEWLMTFVVVKVGPIGITHAGWKFYLLFCIFNVIQVIFVWFFVKETKGRTLEEIDLVFAKKAKRRELQAQMHGRELDTSTDSKEAVDVEMLETVTRDV